MALYVYILHESPIRLWGLSSRQRLERVLHQGGVTHFVKDISDIPPKDSTLIIRGDYLFDERVINSLIQKPNVMLQTGQEGTHIIAAASIPSSLASSVLQFMIEYDRGASSKNPFPNIKIETPETLIPSYQRKLRKPVPPFVLPISGSNRDDLEQRLFSTSYKGITDLITKWAWPFPARWCTKICAHYGVRPNAVTLAGLLLVILASIFFYHGFFGWGLLAGWVMTFLDTVDGKLARVTVTSSKFGHLFDHLIDLIHPPIWYVVWGLGLGVTHIYQPWFSLNIIFLIIIGGYISGRLAELAFKLCLEKSGLFCWRPVDAYFRLITARRNPNLILLTTFTATGHPDLGLLAVAFWTGLTSLFLVVRLAMAGFIHATSGPLQSWLLEVQEGKYDGTMAKKLFTDLN
ncbi:MAG: CDP-alcohol phosphatidyltransferase family protein [Desulfosalsimonadaceae bacterium]